MFRTIVLALFLLVSPAVLVSRSAVAEEMIATVNGVALTTDDLRISLALRGLPETVSPTVRRQAVDWLIERELIRQFLERNKSTVDADALEATIRQTLEQRQKENRPVEPTLESLGIDEARLAAERAVSVAWRRHTQRVTTDEQIHQHFDEHRQRLDGTRLRVSQIFRKYDEGESIDNAPQTQAALEIIRQPLVEGATKFEDAARRESQSPSAQKGGDVGWIGPHGHLPAAVSAAAFALKPGEVSPVVLSPFGAHLVTVTDVDPGELSLEDVRPAILAERADRLWKETVAAERKIAKIVMTE